MNALTKVKVHEITKEHVQNAFDMYNTGARLKDKSGTGDPKIYLIRNPRNGNLYPAKVICVLAVYASHQVYDESSYGPLKAKVKKLGFEFVVLGKNHNITWNLT